MGKKFPTPVISKLLVACLIVVALIGAAVSIWLTGNSKNDATADTSLTAIEREADSNGSTAEPADGDEISTEIGELDKAMNSVDDEGLSDTDLEL